MDNNPSFRLLTLVVSVALSAVSHAQNLDTAKIDTFAHAIARAEGFGIRGAIPTRYHNPGDIRYSPKLHWEGQRRIGKGGHLVFRNDVYGWAALRHQIELAMTGKSNFYTPDMTIHQVAKKYAANWRVWSKNVSRNMGVTSYGAKLRDLLYTYPAPVAVPELFARWPLPAQPVLEPELHYDPFLPALLANKERFLLLQY